jgi:hypothetical protein
MQEFRCLAVLLVVSLWAVRAPAADLTEINRTIAKEPVYKGKPKYCLLVFGSEAKFKVWLVIDGDFLYVDRDGNGDLTPENKRVAITADRNRFFQVGTITAAEGTARTNYTNFHVYVMPKGWELTWYVDKHMYRAGLVPGGLLQFADQAKNAPIIHVNGPLAFSVNRVRLNSKKTHVLIAAYLGSWGLGNGTFAYTEAGNFKIPAGLEMNGEITFPNKKADEAPIKVKFSLEEG